jgi:hypothetical protein
MPSIVGCAAAGDAWTLRQTAEPTRQGTQKHLGAVGYEKAGGLVVSPYSCPHNGPLVSGRCQTPGSSARI